VTSSITGVRRALIAVAAASLVAGCGSSNTSGPSGGASVAPSSTAVFARIDTDLQSPQWQALTPLLQLLPGAAAAALPALDALKGALGPETDAAALSPADLDAKKLVGLTQPESTATLETLLAKHDPPLVSENLGGWQVVAADRETIDRFKRARNEGSLAANSSYQAATEGLPDRALATFYVDGSALTTEVDRRAQTGLGPIPGVGRVSWLAGSLTTAPGGLHGQVRLKGDEIEPYEYTAELPAQVPAPITLFVDAKGLNATLDELRRSPALTGQLATVAKALGGLLDEVIQLLDGEAAFYVRTLPAGPEYTLVIQVADEAAATGTLDRLATLAGALSQALPEHLVVQGVPVTKLVVDKTTLYYAVFGGHVVITSAPSGIRGLALDAAPRLADTPGWQATAAAAGLPEQTAGIVYGDVARALPLLAKLTGSTAKVAAAAPLRTGLAYLTVDGSVLSARGFVAVR
jgi:hypothetical protein